MFLDFCLPESRFNRSKLASATSDFRTNQYVLANVSLSDTLHFHAQSSICFGVTRPCGPFNWDRARYMLIMSAVGPAGPPFPQVSNCTRAFFSSIGSGCKAAIAFSRAGLSMLSAAMLLEMVLRTNQSRPEPAHGLKKLAIVHRSINAINQHQAPALGTSTRHQARSIARCAERIF